MIIKVTNEYGEKFDVNWELNTKKRTIEKSKIS